MGFNLTFFLNLCVLLLCRGYVLPVVKYMAQCWRNTDTDISLIRWATALFFVEKAGFYVRNGLSRKA